MAPPSANQLSPADIRACKGRDEAFACLTAYTTPIAQALDTQAFDAHLDVRLVGASLGMVL